MRSIATRLERRRLVFRRPLRTARGEFHAREIALLEVRDADGLRGLGEASPWPGFGDDTLDAIEGALRAALTRIELVGATTEPKRLLDAVAASLEGHPVARAAVEGAVCDLAARRAGVTLASWLARQVVPRPGQAESHSRRIAPPAAQAPSLTRPTTARVACSALLLAHAPDALREEAARTRAAGYAAAKLKLGGVPHDVDVARVRAARAGLGPGVRLRGDANGAWTRTEAAAALEALAAFDLEYVEQPVVAEDLDGLAGLRGLTPVRIAADEAVAGEHGLRAVIESRAADVVVLKPALLGGPLRALALAAEARAAKLDVVFTHALDGAVGAWHAVHCAAAWADAAAVHGLHTAELFTADVGPPVEADAGFVTLPAGPGLGFESWV